MLQHLAIYPGLLQKKNAGSSMKSRPATKPVAVSEYRELMVEMTQDLKSLMRLCSAGGEKAECDQCDVADLCRNVRDGQGYRPNR